MEFAGLRQTSNSGPNGIDEGKYPKAEKIGNVLVWPKKAVHDLMDDIAEGKCADD